MSTHSTPTAAQEQRHANGRLPGCELAITALMASSLLVFAGVAPPGAVLIGVVAAIVLLIVGRQSVAALTRRSACARARSTAADAASTRSDDAREPIGAQRT